MSSNSYHQAIELTKIILEHSPDAFGYKIPNAEQAEYRAKVISVFVQTLSRELQSVELINNS